VNSIKPEKHILALSGGKDSAALAVYMREKYPSLPLEYVFIDSGCELPETELYIQRIMAVLNIQVTRIGGVCKRDGRDFNWWLKQKNYYLPSPKNRWCTEVLKLIPYSKWLRKNYDGFKIYSYVGLRADEKRNRKGYLDSSNMLVSCHPFVEQGIVYEDVKHLLESSGIGFPSYYSWRSRSGCFFCFYQTKREWLGLHDNHPSLFDEAASMEKQDPSTGKRYTWCEGMFLTDLVEHRFEIEKIPPDLEQVKEKIPKLINTLGNCLHDTNFALMSRMHGDRFDED